MTMDKHYDIIIVGAGPAGTSAALYAEKMGLKTIIFYSKKRKMWQKLLKILTLIIFYTKMIE